MLFPQIRSLVLDGKESRVASEERMERDGVWWCSRSNRQEGDRLCRVLKKDKEDFELDELRDREPMEVLKDRGDVVPEAILGKTEILCGFCDSFKSEDNEV